MTGEIDLFGVFVPALLVAALGAGILLLGLRRVLASIGFYRLVWHRTLVDVALYVILLGVTVLFLSRQALATPPAPVSARGVATVSSLSLGLAPAARIS